MIARTFNTPDYLNNCANYQPAFSYAPYYTGANTGSGASGIYLLGDNSQSDPEIYAAVANKFPERIAAIYIRNINKDKRVAAEEMMASLHNKNITTCLFADNEEAIRHSKAIGLID